MAFRNATYVTFDAAPVAETAGSDANYYISLQSWHKNENNEFYVVNGHEKTEEVRDPTRKLTLLNRLAQSLRCSKNMLIVMTESTRRNKDWLPFEIEYAIETCGIPIIAAYPDYEWIIHPQA